MTGHVVTILCVIKKNETMFNSYGWIQLGMNRKDLDVLDEENHVRYDRLDIELEEKVKSRLQHIADSNEIIRYDLIAGMNNLENFLSIQLSRNHFNPTLREFYQWISEISDGSHGILYEIDAEDQSFNPEKPYRIWRLIGDEFEECKESILNEKFHKINY
tara:strand:+ start:120 stop:599 length:480 start_codon:yes stop_codon:yes gene_type:complete